MIPSFAALRAFDAAFRLGGVRKAAQNLGLSHTVVSRHLASLEDWFGVPLMIRSGKQLELSDVGQRYHAKVSAAFAELALATREVNGDEPDRTLRLCCIPGLSIQWLSGQLIEFERLQPEIRVDLKPTEVPANLHAHEADANIVFLRDSEGLFVADKWIKVQELNRPKQMVVAAPEVVARLGEIGGPEALLNAPLLHGSHQGDWRAWLALNGLETPDRLPGTLCWHVHMAIAAARMGRGILLTNHFLVHEELARGELVQVSVPGTSPAAIGAYMFVARSDRWTSPATASLRRFLVTSMQAG